MESLNEIHGFWGLTTKVFLFCGVVCVGGGGAVGSSLLLLVEYYLMVFNLDLSKDSTYE